MSDGLTFIIGLGVLFHLGLMNTLLHRIASALERKDRQ